jgi:asparagine synthase (glutamine-hydrolysing)
MESDVPLGTLLSGGIDSSLVSAAAQSVLSDHLRTFNVRFGEKEYDETSAAVAVARHIGSRHETLDMNGVRGTWEHITDLLLHAGQPFGDTSLFAVNAVSRAMRRHVTVALSGDGGDEGFGGYHLYWRIARIAHLQKLSPGVWRAGAIALAPLAKLGIVPEHLPKRIEELTDADNTSIVQSMFCWLQEKEHNVFCLDQGQLPVRRLFESQWEHYPPPATSRLELLSMQATEASTRLVLPNDFLFKVDTASMKESLEIRVPMLDEDLFSFALSLPHRLKVNGRTCKRVLRNVAQEKLPYTVASKPKKGFGIPVDRWVDMEFKECLRDTLLGPSSSLPEYFRPDVYSPMVEAFCGGQQYPGVSRQHLYQRAIMLLSVHLAATRSKTAPVRVSPPSASFLC